MFGRNVGDKKIMGVSHTFYPPGGTLGGMGANFMKSTTLFGSPPERGGREGGHRAQISADTFFFGTSQN